MSYIINKNGELVAKTEATLPSGTSVFYSSQKCKEAINANREYNLVNPKRGKISNAKKWNAVYATSEVELATEINEGEYLI